MCYCDCLPGCAVTVDCTTSNGHSSMDCSLEMVGLHVGRHAQVWGVLNKEAPLRLCAYQDWPEATNVELKVGPHMLIVIKSSARAEQPVGVLQSTSSSVAWCPCAHRWRWHLHRDEVMNAAPASRRSVRAQFHSGEHYRVTHYDTGSTCRFAMAPSPLGSSEHAFARCRRWTPARTRTSRWLP